jgi:hypothetical protein
MVASNSLSHQREVFPPCHWVSGAGISPQGSTYLSFLGLYDLVFAILAWATFEYVVTE